MPRWPSHLIIISSSFTVEVPSERISFDRLRPSNELVLWEGDDEVAKIDVPSGD